MNFTVHNIPFRHTSKYPKTHHQPHFYATPTPRGSTCPFSPNDSHHPPPVCDCT
ncbi:hypothetical protein BDF14DRAFT_1857885 [Spinellus fusiger]|nr:hypothetical protein BDF14DRAFT_1857885 [Spinellus fusiger]